MANTHSDIIKDLGGPTAVARAIKMRPNAVQQWIVAGRIPRGRWLDLIEAFPDQITPSLLRDGEPVAA